MASTSFWLIPKSLHMYISPQIKVLLFIVVTSSVFGQQPDRSTVESSKDYYWGEGKASSRNEARTTAEKDLLSKIQVTLNFKFESVVTETNESLTETVNVSSQSYTNLLLKGLNYIDAKKWFKFDTFVYIHKDSVAAAFEIRKAKLRDYSELANDALSEKNVGEALRLYYWGYILGRTYPDQISMKSPEGEEKTVDAALGFQTAIKSILHRIVVEPGICYQDGETVMVPLTFTYAGQPADNLLFSYYSGMGMDYGTVEQGYFELPLYDNPTMASRKLTLNYEYRYENEMADGSETSILNSFFKTASFPNISTVAIKFPWLSEGNESSESKTEIEPQTEVIEMLSYVKEDIGEYLIVLAQYKRLGTISMIAGGQGTENADCWVALADDQQVHRLLFYTRNAFIDIESGESFASLSEFKNLKSIWFREN